MHGDGDSRSLSPAQFKGDAYAMLSRLRRGGLLASSDGEEGAASVNGVTSLDGIEKAGSDDEIATPLLPSNPAGSDNDKTPITYKQHLIDGIKLTYPMILGEVFQNTLPMMDVAFVGQLGKDELGAAALATVWFNMIAGVMTGFMTAIDTLLSNSFGANNHEQYSIWTGVSLVIGMLHQQCLFIFSV